MLLPTRYMTLTCGSLVEPDAWLVDDATYKWSSVIHKISSNSAA